MKTPYPQPKDVIRHWIDSVNDEGHNLSEWELGFMDSITEQFTLRGYVSEKQQDTIERIYTEKVK